MKAVRPVIGIVVALLALINLALGINLLPGVAEAQEKGTFAPLIITWLLVVVSIGSAAALSLFLFSPNKR